MKNKTIRLAMKLSKVPVLGRILKVLLAIYQLPEIRNTVLFEDRFPIMTPQNSDTAISDLSRLNRLINDVGRQSNNLLESVPVTLRSHQRSLDDIISRTSKLEIITEHLSNRIEFIREELLLEQKYGVAKPIQDQGVLQRAETIRAEASKNGTFLRLNLGSGHKPIPGYINVDMRDLPGVDVVAELDKLPFGDNEIDEIFSSHVLEHFPLEKLRREILPHIFLKLKPGGVTTHIAPNIPAMLSAHQAGDISFDWLMKVIYGGQEYEGDFHYSGLSVDTLAALMSEVGFTDITLVSEARDNSGCLEFEIRARK